MTHALRQPLKTIRIHAGQGDVIMATHGLQALIELGAEFLAADACVYTRTDTESLVRALLPGINTASLKHSGGTPHPRYIIVQHLSWTTVLRNWFTPDWYVNFPERRLLASYGYPQPSRARRIQRYLTDIKFGASRDWRREPPLYYAFRMWAPLARTMGFTETDLGRGLYMAAATLKTRLAHYIATLPAAQHATPDVAFFPSGRSFQYVPAAFIRDLIAEAKIPAGGYACYFGPNDPSIAEYQALGLECRTTATMEEMLRVVTGATITATSDSFVSHIAQLVAHEHIALMSQDVPAHVIHPAATSQIAFAPQPCSPCFYTPRDPGARCRAGRAACGVFAMPHYMQMAVTAFARARRGTPWRAA